MNYNIDNGTNSNISTLLPMMLTKTMLNTAMTMTSTLITMTIAETEVARMTLKKEVTTMIMEMATKSDNSINNDIKIRNNCTNDINNVDSSNDNDNNT